MKHLTLKQVQEAYLSTRKKPINWKFKNSREIRSLEIWKINNPYKQTLRLVFDKYEERNILPGINLVPRHIVSLFLDHRWIKRFRNKNSIEKVIIGIEN